MATILSITIFYWLLKYFPKYSREIYSQYMLLFLLCQEIFHHYLVYSIEKFLLTNTKKYDIVYVKLNAFTYTIFLWEG